jgi:predicted metalloprotease with PDZ domain
MMAVWTPGSYLVREYARHVEDVAARTPEGRILDVDKSRKNRWRISTGGAPQIAFSYRVYSREMSVRTNWVEAAFALLNGAPTFVTLVEPGPRPHDVRLILPPDWRVTVTGLPEIAGEPHGYRAPDFDTLVDSPIVAGNPALYEFTVGGKRHVLANVGEAGVWDGPRSAKDVEAIVRENLRFWGELPYDKYVFLNLITEAGGGLEHKNSTVLMTSRWRTRTRRAYLGWLALVSHEFFHVWNVKRLRPVELGPFDYENEVYTRSLWVSEGLTDYYAKLTLARAGLTTPEEFLAEVSNNIESLQTTPGRLAQPLEDASFDAWIKEYRPNENTPNTTISYYTKGDVVSFLLDARIRAATRGARGLDEVMRLAYQRYAGQRGFTPEQFRQTAREVAATDLSEWFRKALNTTEELEYAEALGWYGLRFRKEPERNRAWLGVSTRLDGGRLLVSQIRRGTPAYEAGLNVDDEILAIDEFRVRPDQLSARLEQYQPGQRVRLVIARRELLMELPVTLGREPAPLWRLEVDPAAGGQEGRLTALIASKP